VIVEPPTIISGCAVGCDGAASGKSWVDPATTTNAADESRLSSWLFNVALPPGVNVCPGAMKNSVAALAVKVEEPMVMMGGTPT
jgi:hypothetical protein